MKWADIYFAENMAIARAGKATEPSAPVEEVLVEEPIVEPKRSTWTRGSQNEE